MGLSSPPRDPPKRGFLDPPRDPPENTGFWGVFGSKKSAFKHPPGGGALARWVAQYPKKGEKRAPWSRFFAVFKNIPPVVPKIKVK